MQINFEKSSHILFFAGILSVLSLGVAWLFSLLHPPFWLETLSPLGAYALFYSLFDKFVWRWKIFKWIGISSYPDLNGRWTGKQISSYKVEEKNVESPACIEIIQTFSKVTVNAFYTQSESKSVVAVFTQFGDDMYLYYTYDNDPNISKADTMHTHKGTVKLKYLGGDKKLNGSYFNSRGNVGDMYLEFKGYKLKGCFS